MRETAENLEKMRNFGISEGISELILTTRNDRNGSKYVSNAAPFGIVWKNDRMFLHLFKGSKTCENMMRENLFAANMTDDAVLYATTTFYDLEDDEFGYAEYGYAEYDYAEYGYAEYAGEESVSPKEASIPYLKNADRVVLFKCVGRTEAEDSVIIDIEPADFIVLKPDKAGFIFNRGFHSVVEACIHLTRYELTKDQKYVDLIRHHWGITQRCGRKRDKEGVAVLRKKMNEILDRE
ncbi:MAG: DUF447 family protein [Methanimicrococcus sp.]|nr:DUF447 family protein [Methanimicrococcus sp.]